MIFYSWFAAIDFFVCSRNHLRNGNGRCPRFSQFLLLPVTWSPSWSGSLSTSRRACGAMVAQPSKSLEVHQNPVSSFMSWLWRNLFGAKFHEPVFGLLRLNWIHRGCNHQQILGSICWYPIVFFLKPTACEIVKHVKTCLWLCLRFDWQDMLHQMPTVACKSIPISVMKPTAENLSMGFSIHKFLFDRTWNSKWRSWKMP